MSAKKNRKPAGNTSAPPVPATAPIAAATADVAPAEAAAAPVAWIDSPDPRKRQIAKIILVGVWIYVAALWLLAMDQWFHWGIFGPKVPPVP
jgi:hypothetical protein